MRSVTCTSCGFVSWAVSGFPHCKQCGKSLPLNETYHRPQPPPSHGHGAAPSYFDAAPDHFGAPMAKRTGHAVASLVIGITGFFTCGLFLIGSIVGTVLGIVALKRASSEPATYGGKGMAVAGLVLNLVALVMIVPIIASIAIPNLLASRRAANEASALRTISVLMAAEQTYYSSVGSGEFGELGDLVQSRLIETELLGGVRNGYRFTLVNNGSDFEVSATPVSEASGSRSFFYASTDDVLRARVGGQPATADDPPLEFYNDSQTRHSSQSDLRGPAYVPTN
jgi:type II secretory pathway pseudopilin PulG